MESKNEAIIGFYMQQGKYIYGRVKINGDPYESFSTGLKINPDRWDNGDVVGSDAESKRIKSELHEIRKKIEEIKTSSLTTPKDLVNAYKNPEKYSTLNAPSSLIEMFNYYIRSIKEFGSSQPETITAYEGKLRSVERWLYDIKLSDITIPNLNRRVIKEYVLWLKNNGLNSEYSQYQYFAAIGTVINYCVNDFIDDPNYLKYNPIKGAISRPNSQKMKKNSLANCLPKEYQQKMIDLEVTGTLVGKSKEWWKWTAIFQMRSGFSFADLGSNEWSIEKTIEGLDVIELFRKKTDTICTIPLYDELKECVEKLKELQGDRSRIFPIRRFVYEDYEDKATYNTDYQNYRMFLKYIKKEIGYEDQLSTHTLRHTFGMSMANNYGFTQKEIQNMMGHTDSRTTDIYSTVTKERIAIRAEQLMSNSSTGLKKTGN